MMKVGFRFSVHDPIFLMKTESNGLWNGSILYTMKQNNIIVAVNRVDLWIIRVLLSLDWMCICLSVYFCLSFLCLLARLISWFWFLFSDLYHPLKTDLEADGIVDSIYEYLLHQPSEDAFSHSNVLYLPDTIVYVHSNIKVYRFEARIRDFHFFIFFLLLPHSFLRVCLIFVLSLLSHSQRYEICGSRWYLSLVETISFRLFPRPKFVVWFVEMRFLLCLNVCAY